MIWDDPARTETAYYSCSRQVGPYKLVRLLGEDEDVQAWEGIRLNPHRPASVRIFAPPPGWDEFARRSAHERVKQVSQLRHPGIASVYESGDTEEAQIWLATELSDAGSLSEWLEKNPAPVPLTSEAIGARCDLLLEICAAVLRGHQSGVLHLALNPFNVSFAHSTQVKLHDLGLSRVLPGQKPGAWRYLSPEQLHAEGDVDCRADVYALGVIAAEILSGSHPFFDKGTSYTEAVKVLAEESPRPIAGLNPELSAVIGKALNREPEGRFESVDALASALQLALRVRRGPRPAAIAASVALLALATASGWLLLDNRGLKQELQGTRALLQREQGLTRFLTGIYGSPAALDSPAQVEMSRRLLSDAEARARRDFIEPEKLTSRLIQLGMAYNQLADYEASKRVAEQALELHRARIRQETADLGDVLNLLALNHYNLAQYREAERYATEGIGVWRRVRPADPESLARAFSELGQALGAMGEYGKAEAPLKEAVETYRRSGTAGSDYLDALRAYGVNMTRQGRWEEGLPQLREAAAKYLAEQGNTSNNYLRTLNDLGNALAWSGKLAEAAARQADLIGVVETVMGKESPNLAISHLNLAITLTKMNSLAKARTELSVGEAIFRKSLGEQHPRFAEFQQALGDIESRDGAHDKALALLQQALAHERKTLPPGSLNEGFTLASIAQAQRRAGHHAEAVDFSKQALQILSGKLPESHPVLADLRAIK